MTIYTARVSRADRAWHLCVPGTAYETDVRTLRQVEPTVRRLLAEAGDVDEGLIEVRVDLEVPARAAVHWRAASELHTEAARLRARAAQEASLAARELHDLGLTVREIGEVLAVSHQRADQLLHRPSPPSAEAP